MKSRNLVVDQFEGEEERGGCGYAVAADLEGSGDERP